MEDIYPDADDDEFPGSRGTVVESRAAYPPLSWRELSLLTWSLIAFALWKMSLCVALPFAYAIRDKWPFSPNVDLPFGLSIVGKHYVSQL